MKIKLNFMSNLNGLTYVKSLQSAKIGKGHPPNNYLTKIKLVLLLLI